MANVKALLLFCFSFAFFTFYSCAHDGVVNISGTIQDNTCELAPDSQNKIIEMGVLSLKQFTQQGERTPEKSFSINLNHCGPAASEASVTFSGTPASSDNTLYSVDQSSDAATGIALGIYDSNGTLLPPGKASEGIPLQGGQESVEMKYTASYISQDKNVTAGVANVTLTFVVNYA